MSEKLLSYDSQSSWEQSRPQGPLILCRGQIPHTFDNIKISLLTVTMDSASSSRSMYLCFGCYRFRNASKRIGDVKNRIMYGLTVTITRVIHQQKLFIQISVTYKICTCTARNIYLCFTLTFYIPRSFFVLFS